MLCFSTRDVIADFVWIIFLMFAIACPHIAFYGGSGWICSPSRPRENPSRAPYSGILCLSSSISCAGWWQRLVFQYEASWSLYDEESVTIVHAVARERRGKRWNVIQSTTRRGWCVTDHPVLVVRIEFHGTSLLSISSLFQCECCPVEMGIRSWCKWICTCHNLFRTTWKFGRGVDQGMNGLSNAVVMAKRSNNFSVSVHACGSKSVIEIQCFTKWSCLKLPKSSAFGQDLKM